MDWESLGPRRRKPTKFTLDGETYRLLAELAEQLGISRSRVVDLLTLRFGIKAGLAERSSLGEYAKADQKRLGLWYRRTLRERRRAKEAARRGR